MNKLQLKSAFYNELQLGKDALQKKEHTTAFYHFENAHILGQKR